MLQFPTLLELATLHVPCLSVDHSLAQASALLAQQHVDRLVVLRAGKPVGVLASSEVLNAWGHGVAASVSLDHLPLAVVPILPANADWQAAMRCLIDPATQGMLLVVDEAGALLGLLTEEDFCRRLGMRHLSGVHAVLAALRDSEQMLKAVFDSTQVFLGLLQPDGRLIAANCAALQVIGIGAKLPDVVGILFWQAPWWAHDAKLQAQVHDAVVLAQQGLVSGFEASLEMANGESICIDFTLRPIRDETGMVSYLLPEGRDVTKRRHAEWALRASQIHYQALLNATPVGVMEMDAAGRCIYVNQKYTEITGLDPAQALGDGWARGIHPDDLEQLLRARTEACSSAVPGSLEYRYVLPDGQAIWVMDQTAPMTTFDGVVSGTIVTLIDITERKELEIRLSLAASMYEASSEGILVVDAQNHIVSVNPAFTALLGYEAAEVLGRDPGELGSSRRNSPSLYKTLWQTVEKNGHWQGEIWNRCKDGQDVALWMTVNTLCDSAGEVQWRFALFSDITEKKRTEELIWRQANYDALTGLPNRRLFRDRLRQEMKRAARDDNSLALFFMAMSELVVA